MIKNLLKKIFLGETSYEHLIEGVYAHQYPELDGRSTRTKIREDYRQKWPEPSPDPTPLTHPWLFDPCDPPKGWAYDPYYELWIEHK